MCTNDCIIFAHTGAGVIRVKERHPKKETADIEKKDAILKVLKLNIQNNSHLKIIFQIITQKPCNICNQNAFLFKVITVKELSFIYIKVSKYTDSNYFNYTVKAGYSILY